MYKEITNPYSQLNGYRKKRKYKLLMIAQDIGRENRKITPKMM